MRRLDVEGRSPLHYAAMSDDIEQSRLLISEGEDVNLGDRLGFAPLHFAAQEGAARVAALLLEEGAEVDALDAFGNTPLFVAVFNSRGGGDLIELFRAHGADPMHANDAGQTPVGLARLIGNYDAAPFFADLPA
jgi:ankyrin repeat protein